MKCIFHANDSRTHIYRLTGDPTRKLQLVYARVLGQRLADRVRELDGRKNAAINLRDELTLMRAVAMDAIEQYEKIHTGIAAAVAAGKLTDAKQAELTASAMSYVAMALEKVRDMAVAAQRVEREVGVDIGAVQAVLLQSVKIVDERVVEYADRMISAGIDPQEFIDGISERVHTEIRITGRKALKDAETLDGEIDELHYDMDATITGEDTSSSGLRAVS